ncbi:transaldolase [Helicobacter saguini]|uniref:Transaldolase n=1 Tax=Helicobacter saguini TaxID=1548018 RepID=A0A347VTU4_9HELI|nr:transaldolase [Helicobacter saguini]MWV61570.1 transaldolase [Helicobacter saguini]MWV67759.1 transaldolase [Helicobacter saguini]MWV70773.1 transaldolase [Helicobacter saguini]MWV72677.1 transaldolase [Helicobacter saguini]TLD94520.1 transaldolase [Helicobacter saguini]
MVKIWCDFIERGFLESEFRELVNRGKISGATSNPSIFANALKSKNYADSIQSLKAQGKKGEEIYEILAIEDIKLAAKILAPLHEKDARDGLISLELNPALSENVPASIDSGVRLWREIDSKNAMIKVPATKSGYEIMEQLMLREINVNATLVFSKAQAREVLAAFKRAGTGAQGVISVFVSRFDRVLDSKLPRDLQGKIGIANAIDIYKDFCAENTSENYRILFASTGVKTLNDVYEDAGYYVYPLAFSDCVNTLPLDTLSAIDFSRLSPPTSLESHASHDFLSILESLKDYKINLHETQHNLLIEGLKAFETSFEEMLGSL